LIFKDIIEEINISTEIQEVYGNLNYRIYFNVELSEGSYHNQSGENKTLINYYFANNNRSSGSEFISYSIRSKHDLSPETYQRELTELKTFYDCYTSLTLFLANLLESELKNIKYKIQNLDNLQKFKRLNKFFEEVRSRELYENSVGVNFESDIYQHEKLKSLSEQSNNDYDINKLNYYISDNTLLHGYKKYYIRSFVLDEKIPIRFETVGVLEIVYINAVEFKNKLILPVHKHSEWIIKNLHPKFLMEEILMAEKKFKRNNKKEINNQKKIKLIGICKGDVLYLKDTKLVAVKETLIENGNIFYKYIELTEKLTIRKRLGTGRISLNEIYKYLPQVNYEEYKTKFQWHSATLVKRYINKSGYSTNKKI
jgi:hypothetical protein